MNKSNLNVFRFRTESGNNYIFDNTSGMIFPCTDAMYYTVTNFYNKDKESIVQLLVRQFEMDEKSSNAVYRKVKKLLDNGNFYDEEIPELYSDLTERDLLKSPLSQLILIVTEDCNIRCKYCIYSDNYPHVKGYSKQQMSFDVAKKAIDYYMKLHQMRVNSGYRRKPIITFYGGEPLLEFQLMKDVIKYCGEQNYEPKIFVTTNATLFNEEMIKFFIENDIVITFSLDGFKANNDRNRIFPNGKGTFDLIMSNIIKLQNEKKKRNIEQAISFSCCFDSYSDMCAIVDFFNVNHDLFYPYNIIFNEISKYNTTYYEYCSKAHKEGVIKEDVHTFDKTVKVLQEEFLNCAINYQKVNSVGLTYLFMGLINIIWRSKGHMDSNKLSCTPGSKIAVSPDGNFFICEKVSQMCSIGDVNNGIDFKKVNELNNKYLLIRRKHCKDCTISRLCSICYMHLVQDDDLKFNYEMCKDNKKIIPNSLKIVFSVLEKNPNAFDVLSPSDPKRELYEISR